MIQLTDLSLLVMGDTSPPRLQGRAGAVRLRNWQEDVTAIVIYWPPKPQDMSSRASYVETLYGLAEWLRKTLQDTHKRSTPYIMTNLNDLMEDPAVTGNLSPEREEHAVTLFRDMLQDEGMAVINTFLQLVRSTQRHDHFCVIAVFQRDQWKEKARDEPAGPRKP